MDVAPAFNENKDRVDKLRGFVDNQRAWSEGLCKDDAATMMVSQGMVLTQLGSALDPSLQAFTAVVGDQSAGKTTITMSLLKQVILDVKEDTATTVRTFLKQSCDMKQGEAYICSMKYKDGFNRSDMSPNDLYNMYQGVSEFNKQHVFGKIDTDNLCEISVSTKKPSLGLQVMDHPGFAATVEDPVRKSFQETLKNFFTGDKPCNNASVLLCHALGKTASESFFGTCHQEYNKVGENQLYVALTKCDRLSSHTQKEAIAKLMFEKKYHVNAKNVKVTPTQLLDFIQNQVLELEYEDTKANAVHRALPDHARFFFVTSFRGRVEDLLANEDPEKRFDMFMNDKNHGECATEKEFRDALADKAGWFKVNVVLLDEDADAKERIEERVGMKKLREALLRRSAEAYQGAADTLIDTYKCKCDRLLSELQKEDSIDYSPDVVNTMEILLRKYVETYFVLTQTDLENPNTSPPPGNHSTHREIAEQMKDAYDKLRQDKNFGWTLKDELEIFDNLKKKGHFPHPSYAEEDWEQKFENLLPYCVQAKDRRKERQLTSLIRRVEQEFALRSCLVAVPEVDVEKLQQDRHTSTSQLTGDLKDPLMNHIQNTYSKIYMGDNKDGGAAFMATRVALACLLHAQVVLSIMQKVDHFGSVLGGRGAAGMVKGRSDTREGDLVWCLQSQSRVQNQEHRGKAENSRDPPESQYQFADGSLDDMIDEARKKQYPERNPFEDLCSIIVAHFFDHPYEQMAGQLNTLARKISLCSPAYTPLSHHMGPLFVHQNHEFLKKYKQKHPLDHFPHKFVQDTTQPESLSNFFEELNTAVTSPGNLASAADLASRLPFDSTVVQSATELVESVKQAQNGAAKSIAGTVTSRFSLTSPSTTAASADGSSIAESDASSSTGPQTYSKHPGGVLFNDLTEETIAQLRSINSCTQTNCEDRARLLSSMIKADRLPDTIGPFENSDQPGDFDEACINYVFQRHMSCSVRRTLDDGLEACTSLLYDKMHFQKAETHQREVLNRFESLLLGYQYPHTCEDRPAMYRYRDAPEVIQFLYNNKSEILELCRPKESSSAGERKKKVSCLDYQICNSPLFKKVVELASSDDPTQRSEATTLIESLFRAWVKTQAGHGGDGHCPESDSRKIITQEIVRTLMPDRYKHIHGRDKRWAERQKRQYQKLCNAIGALKSYSDFVKTHGNKLALGAEAMETAKPESWKSQNAPPPPRRYHADLPPAAYEPVEQNDMSDPTDLNSEDDLDDYA